MVTIGTELQFSSSYHPQMDGQIEVVNPSLGDMVKCLAGEKPKKMGFDASTS